MAFFGGLSDRFAGHAVRRIALVASLLSPAVVPLALGLDASAGIMGRPSTGALGRLAVGQVASDESNKGVCVWAFPGVSAALKESGAAWYLTWSTTHSGVVTPPGSQFVPMVARASSVTVTALAQAERSGQALLTFNEPDLDSQANMSVAEALSIWPKLMATGLQLASPAVAAGAATPGGWLDQFMRGVERRHYRVNFIAVHWYGSDFRTGAAVAELRSYLESVHRRYELPVWLTEYALIDFSVTGPIYPPPVEQAAFVTASVRMLDNLAFVKRYAWFALAAPSSGPSTGLYSPGPSATAAGLAFARA